MAWIASMLHYVHVLILSNMEYYIDFLNIRGMELDVGGYHETLTPILQLERWIVKYFIHHECRYFIVAFQLLKTVACGMAVSIDCHCILHCRILRITFPRSADSIEPKQRQSKSVVVLSSRATLSTYLNILHLLWHGQEWMAEEHWARDGSITRTIVTVNCDYIPIITSCPSNTRHNPPPGNMHRCREAEGDRVHADVRDTGHVTTDITYKIQD